jgi:Tol biopolymer transport system component
VAPFWSPDSQRVLFINRPAPDGPAGIWALDLQGGAAQLFSGRVALYSPDMHLIAYPSNGRTYVERPTDGQRWLIPSDGHAVSFSPDSFLVTWTISTDGPFDRAQRAIWVSQFDGSQARRLDTPTGGSFSAWFPDGRMLISERLDEPQSGLILWALAPQEESAAASEPQASEPQAHKLLEITTDGRLRGFSLSPDGRWLAYMLTLPPTRRKRPGWPSKP